MSGLLLDTNALVWFLNETPLEADALFAIAAAQDSNQLYVSPISAWEASLAIKKPNEARRPNLNGLDAATWFRQGRKNIGARLASISEKVALEAARVPDVYGNGDPGDCYLIATARVKGWSIVTRDRRMARLAAAQPNYLSIVAC